MNKINWKDVAARTAKTFIATFIGTFSFVDALFIIKDKNEMSSYIASSLISAASAAVTAVWNVLLEIFGDRINAAVDKVVTWVFNLLPKKQAGEGADQIDEDQGDLDRLSFDDPASYVDLVFTTDDALEEYNAEYYADEEEDPADEGEVG